MLNIFKKISSIKVIILTIMLLFVLNNNYATSTFQNGIEAFPDSYKPYLLELQSRYPNWTFTALNTGLNWNDVIAAQTVNNKSLIPKSFSDAWKRDNIDVLGEVGWVNASNLGVQFAIDARNYLTDVQIFQFENLQYNESVHNLTGIDNIFWNTSMYQRLIQYHDANSQIHNINKTYAQVVLEAGQTLNISPFHLASRIKQETGCNIATNLSINGLYNQWYNGEHLGDYRGLYNFYNISAFGTYPIREALKYAKSPGIYGRPWDNPEKAIKGGAEFISNRYVNNGQNTKYLQKFNVSTIGNSVYTNQYMTNIRAPYTEAASMYLTYNQNNNMNYPHNFVIPVFNNIPQYAVDLNRDNNNYTPDNTLVYLDGVSPSGGQEEYRLRNTPDDSIIGNIIKRIRISTSINKLSNDNPYIVTRIGRGDGVNWDRIKIKEKSTGLEMIGYMWKPFVKVLPIANLETISNVNPGTKVSEIRTRIAEGGNVQVINMQGVTLNDTDSVGTGSVVHVRDNANNIISSHEVVIYGDLSGDGVIDSLDILRLRRHLLNVTALDGAVLKAADISRTGQIDSLDILMLRRHLLNVRTISQE